MRLSRTLAAAGTSPAIVTVYPVASATGPDGDDWRLGLLPATSDARTQRALHACLRPLLEGRLPRLRPARVSVTSTGATRPTLRRSPTRSTTFTARSAENSSSSASPTPASALRRSPHTTPSSDPSRVIVIDSFLDLVARRSALPPNAPDSARDRRRDRRHAHGAPRTYRQRSGPRQARRRRHPLDRRSGASRPTNKSSSAVRPATAQPTRAYSLRSRRSSGDQCRPGSPRAATDTTSGTEAAQSSPDIHPDTRSCSSPTDRSPPARPAPRRRLAERNARHRPSRRRPWAARRRASLRGRVSGRVSPLRSASRWDGG